MRTAIFADVLADLIQLTGRARRGGTDTTLYLVDNAFHRGGAAPGSDFSSPIRALHRHWQDTSALDQVAAIYGTTLDAFLDFAGLTDRTRYCSHPSRRTKLQQRELLLLLQLKADTRHLTSKFLSSADWNPAAFKQ